MRRLFVVIPIFNEPGTLSAIVQQVVDAPLPIPWTRHMVLVDDCSAPRGRAAVDDVFASLRARSIPADLLRHDVNEGKGSALRTGMDHILDFATDADAMIVQDADLEYSPSDYAQLLEPIIEGWAGAVFGTRWGDHRTLSSRTARLHAAGNRALTALSNLMTGLSVLDMECCYKLLTLPALRRVRPWLTEDRFGIEPQLAAALARERVQVAQRPVRYSPRGFSDGKKIGVIDGLRAIYVILRERLIGGPPW